MLSVEFAKYGYKKTKREAIFTETLIRLGFCFLQILIQGVPPVVIRTQMMHSLEQILIRIDLIAPSACSSSVIGLL